MLDTFQQNPHGYVTHLHEAGTYLLAIRELLGHSSSKASETYTHDSRRLILQIPSPFDTLWAMRTFSPTRYEYAPILSFSVDMRYRVAGIGWFCIIIKRTSARISSSIKTNWLTVLLSIGLLTTYSTLLNINHNNISLGYTISDFENKVS